MSKMSFRMVNLKKNSLCSYHLALKKIMVEKRCVGYDDHCMD